MADIRINALFEEGHTIAAPLLARAEYPWQVLSEISDFIIELGRSLPCEEYTLIADNVWAARDAKIAPSASVNGPCIIDKGAEVRHCAYIRGSAIVGKGSVVGNSCELKNCIISDGVQVPHFNYVGDSILGYKSHMGAGSVTSNVKSDKSLVVIKNEGEEIPTGRKKVGAFLGDFVEVGCNSVLCPGSIICKNSTVYPTSCVRGVVAQNSIYKKDGVTVKKI
ncbi:MAG: UDP-N-acetylglucosamine pyrophosphorylase [Ruminococcaceae bacterium]|nr:UDP-N-acetylglucosamine pyrophosphorylase [Oscillospiraceae bacterium]